VSSGACGRGRAIAAARRTRACTSYAAARGGGLSARAFSGGPPVVTTPGCRLEAFLSAKQIPHLVAAWITETAEYLAIERAYGTRTTQRSGVPLMRHIDEGLAVLQRHDHRSRPDDRS
jgi:hypothetical protein